MSWLEIVASYGFAYLFLSVCIGLVVGRLFHMAGQTDVGDAASAATENNWSGHHEAGGVELGSVEEFKQAH